ncbi:MAG: hypothetical protein AAF619_11045 [Pseudomonadota bacterium]
MIKGLAITLLFAVLSVGSANAADFSKSGHHGKKERFNLWPERQCDSPKILNLISKRFEKSQRKTFHRELAIVSLENPQTTAERHRDPKFHDRKFCKAQATLSNGSRHHVFYLLSHDGYPPLSNGLVFCIPAYDYFRAYAPDCQQVRPR